MRDLALRVSLLANVMIVLVAVWQHHVARQSRDCPAETGVGVFRAEHGLAAGEDSSEEEFCPAGLNDAVSNVVCSAWELPRVAFCFAGTARGVATPLAYRSTRSNLIDAYGGRATVFGYIKLGDESMVKGRPADDRHGRRAIRKAFAHLGANVSNPDHLLIEDNVTIKLPKCEDPNYIGHQDTRSAEEAQGDARWSVFNTRSYYMSFLAQLKSRAVCHDMIVKEEMRSGQKFDTVFYVRSDYVWPVPLRPFCMWDGSYYR